MNKNYVVFSSVVVAVIAILVGVYILVSPPQTGNYSIIFSPLVKGCAQTDKGTASRATGLEQEPKIEVNGNSIKYSRAIEHQCCRKVELQKEINGSAINIFEVWSGQGCRCMCFSEIEAELKNIPSGSYTVNVYEKGAFPDGKPMEQKLVITQKI